MTHGQGQFLCQGHNSFLNMKFAWKMFKETEVIMSQWKIYF